MNIILVGCGKIGHKIVEKLSNEKEHDITVVDLRQNVVDELVNMYDVMGVVGDCVNADILEEAGVKEADILIASTGSDELNFTICLLAKKMGDCQTIARTRKPEYSKTINLFKDDLGLALVINSHVEAAQEISRNLKFPNAIQVDTFAKGRIEILKFRIPENSVLCNMKLYEMQKKLNCELLVCGVERETDVFIPDGNFVFKQGDLVSIVSTYKNCQDFFKKIGIKTNKVKDVVIIGGGVTGYYLAQMLLQSGIKVKIIERDKKRCEELSVLFPKAIVINGDGTDNKLLLEEGIENAGAVVALTNIDEENILISLFAKSKNCQKLITKINKIEFDEVIRKLDLDTIIYPKTLAAENVLRFVRAKNNSYSSSNIETIHFILDGKAEALEFKINEKSRIVGKSLFELNIRKNVIVACINRNGKIIIPKGQDSIEVNDSVIIVTTIGGLKDINDILEG
ncbi:MAG: Trk system potassium transporter TrkA [Ruminococcaceae bacterium]|nr:Trk system potassium transporter TrkA [Oscillospiraceae bacterium]